MNKILFFIFIFSCNAYAARKLNNEAAQDVVNKFCKLTVEPLMGVDFPRSQTPDSFLTPHTPSDQVEALSETILPPRSSEPHQFVRPHTPSDRVEPLVDRALLQRESTGNPFAKDLSTVDPSLEPMAPVKKETHVVMSDEPLSAVPEDVVDFNKGYYHKLALLELKSKKLTIKLKDVPISNEELERMFFQVFEKTISELKINGENYVMDVSEISNGEIEIEFLHVSFFNSQKEELKLFFGGFLSRLNQVQID